ncbi:MAG: nucleoside hydrolase [Candidatus Marinimicrobia bacterium]|nr:nucleoside hydrolase [Candidatus Neomarinimicrobiota bacterium]MBT4454272.1 nucleoside hydrolase [Candidatus Neomarinimicrobiota bacterium]MBT6943446.1 nucleoside hydrolase [Candidatus Neomarinimicrobiota bacterium]MBT7083051.1 nucleoside hydrolase [Candidatus Neomarinimicrobiota bacterium]MBT7920961.1 nucleoside hydrolase [Candidatus Neomarinimicrobiota bacterium]
MNIKKQIILDCDPGQDDAVAMALAMAATDEIEILGITAVAGNVPLNLTQRNARLMCDICQRTDMIVYAGAEKPMAHSLVTAEHVHGKSGLDGIDIVEPITPLQEKHGVDYIIETCLSAADNSITLVPTGPLTNIGLAIHQESNILPKIKEIVLMGGTLREGGNITPSAEFNIYVDPEAAQIVLRCGRPIVMMSLDVTHQVLTTRKRVDAIRNLDSTVGEPIASLIEFYERYDEEKYHLDGAPLHDPCTIAYLIKPDLFSLKEVNVEVETGGKFTRGATVVDYWDVTGRLPNVQWAHTVDANGFFELLNNYLSKI